MNKRVHRNGDSLHSETIGLRVPLAALRFASSRMLAWIRNFFDALWWLSFSQRYRVKLQLGVGYNHNLKLAAIC